MSDRFKKLLGDTAALNRSSVELIQDFERNNRKHGIAIAAYIVMSVGVVAMTATKLIHPFLGIGLWLTAYMIFAVIMKLLERAENRLFQKEEEFIGGFERMMDRAEKTLFGRRKATKNGSEGSGHFWN
jgi:hypothetical protein